MIKTQRGAEKKVKKLTIALCDSERGRDSLAKSVKHLSDLEDWHDEEVRIESSNRLEACYKAEIKTFEGPSPFELRILPAWIFEYEIEDRIAKFYNDLSKWEKANRMEYAHYRAKHMSYLYHETGRIRFTEDGEPVGYVYKGDDGKMKVIYKRDKDYYVQIIEMTDSKIDPEKKNKKLFDKMWAY